MKKSQKIADELLEAYPNENKVFVSADGQGFFSEGDAKNHKGISGKDYEPFFRDGHSDEIDSDAEEMLLAAEQKLDTANGIISAVIDISNTEAEEIKEVSEESPEAVKAVSELRKKFEDAKETFDNAASETVELRTFREAVIELVKDDKTKLAESITKLIPVKTEE